MSTPKWTPGPHVYIPGASLRDENNEEFEATIIATSDAVLATFSYYDGKPTHANGELWSAAPDLYVALERARSRMAKYGESIEELREIDVALAKARGEK